MVEKEYIEREKVILAISNVPEGNWSNRRYVSEIEKLPAADVVERKRGYWKPVKCREMFGGDPEAWYGHGDPVACHLCSKCNGYPWLYDDGNEALTDFCPNCGADMRADNG